jgi:exoribonuclease-2
LNENEDRLAMVVEMVFERDGELTSSDVYRAGVRNRAQLAYDAVSVGLEDGRSWPAKAAAVAGVTEQLQLQDRVAGTLKRLRHERGALDLETIEPKAVFEDDQVVDVRIEPKNRARSLIEDFMIAANGVTARYLAAKNFPSIRRVVRTPKRWDRIVELARTRGTGLPANPDSVALDTFLVNERAADPAHFPDLSLAVIKLLGAGEYVAEPPGVTAPGHFGLAVKDYTHSTAPNRRYPDLITQRLLKSAIAGRAAPYTYVDLAVLAKHCTEEEDAANKVERQVGKSAAAMLLESRIGEQFAALVTGASAKGTWARLLTIPVEGRVVRGFERMEVGDQIRVQLASVNVERGFIDLRSIDSARR